jgi:hypothetical protein
MPFRHEKFVAKVQEKNSDHFREGERVEDAVPGATKILTKDEGAWGDLLVLLITRKKLGSRLIILTDRNLYLAATGMFAPWKIKEVKVSYPRNEAGAHLRAVGRTAVVVDGERVAFEELQEKRVRAFVKAAGGAEWTTADEIREVRANFHPVQVLVGIVLGVLIWLFVTRSQEGFDWAAGTIALILVGVVLFRRALDRRKSAQNKDR